MKRLWRYFRRTLLVLVAMLGLVTLGVFLYNQWQLTQEQADFTASQRGTRVQVEEGVSLNVYEIGQGSQTLVLLSGAGTTSPILDFHVLTDRLQGDFRLIVVERLDYGWSDDGDSSRDVATVNRQTRAALHRLELMALMS